MTGPKAGWIFRWNRQLQFSPEDLEQAASMGEPVQCTHCGKVYDLRAVTGAQNYADCSVWRAPCCGREVDDRKITIHYRPVTRQDTETVGAASEPIEPIEWTEPQPLPDGWYRWGRR